MTTDRESSAILAVAHWFLFRSKDRFMVPDESPRAFRPTRLDYAAIETQAALLAGWYRDLWDWEQGHPDVCPCDTPTTCISPDLYTRGRDIGTVSGPSVSVQTMTRAEVDQARRRVRAAECDTWTPEQRACMDAKAATA